MTTCQPRMTCQPYNGFSDQYDLSDEAFKPVWVLLKEQRSGVRKGDLNGPALLG